MPRQLTFRHFYLPAVFLAATFLADANLRSGIATEPALQTRSTGAPVPDLTGDWSGRWTDTRFSVTDSVSFSIVVNGPDVSGTGTLGLMNAFGLPDEAGTITGTITGDQLSFTFTTNTATGGGTIINTALNDGVGSIGGLLNFGGYTFTGTVSDVSMTWDFVFDDPSGGFGTVALTQPTTPVEESTWGRVKSQYAE